VFNLRLRFEQHLARPSIVFEPGVVTEIDFLLDEGHQHLERAAHLSL
jgi:hypothetical protein